MEMLPMYMLAICFLLSIAEWLVTKHKNEGLEGRKAELTAELAALRREAARLNTPSTYAKCAKLQRIANAKEKELAALHLGGSTWHDKIVRGVSVTKSLLVVASAIMLWRKPVLQLPKEVMWPLGTMLASPHGKQFSAYGLIAAAPWMVLCSRAAGAIARSLFVQRTPAGPAAAKTASLLSDLSKSSSQAELAASKKDQ